MDKLITNHAYLFIKKGLGEIQRGNTVLTSFNLQSVIKRNTAVRLQKCCLIPAFSWFRLTPSLGAFSTFKQGLVFLLQPFGRPLDTWDFGQVPLPARVSVSSSAKWVHDPLAVRTPEERGGDGYSGLFQSSDRSCVGRACFPFPLCPRIPGCLPSQCWMEPA